MKKRTRILSMLLTLVMVIGLLPLSLFAASGTDDMTEVTVADRSYKSVSAALVSNGFTSHLYLDFESETAGLIAQSAKNTDGNVIVSQIQSPTGGHVDFKNYKQAFSINEENGNKSFYFGSAAKMGDNDDNYLDAVPGAESTRGNDLFLSVDFKMGGKNIVKSNDLESALCFINRDVSKNSTPTVWLSAVGGIYLDKNLSPESLVGYLSDTEYTSISVHVKLSENKYYVYINDVLVNPEGKAFLPLGEDGTYYGTGKTPEEYMLTQVRIYDVIDNVPDSDGTENAHAGLHVDNIILASRAQRAEHNTEYKNLFTSDFSNAKVGTGLVANENISGVSGASGVALTANAVLPNEKILSYVKDGDDTVLKVGKPSGAGTDGQSYFSLFGLAGYVGKNYSISIDVKMGSATIGNTYQLINPINRSTSPATNVGSLYLYTDGKLKYNGVEIGTISAEKYTKVTMDIVCNDTAVKVYLYVDGELKNTFPTIKAPWNSPSAYYLSDIAFACGYTGVLTNMKENELYIKNVSVSLTEGYNSGNYISSPFKNDAVGFVKNAGLARYYNEDGSFKTEDFTVDGVKYIVGFNGNVLGKESDGIEMSYADYFKSTFTYGTDKNVKLGESLNASCFGSAESDSMMKPVRNGVNSAATVGGEAARYYASYFNSKTGSQDSYWDFNTPNYKNDQTIVFDFDIMLDAYEGSRYGVCGLVTTKGLDESGSRSTLVNDTAVLIISSDGWLSSGDKKLVPLSRREFTKVSAVIRTPETGKNNGTYDIYVNGVLMIENAALASGMYGLQGFRNFRSDKQTVGMYVKNISLYAKADRPMQFMTMEGGEAVLTNDQSKTPAKASDIKRGLVNENGVYRYYDELGLPIVSVTVTIGGVSFEADANGKINCGDTKHIGTAERGICSVCGKKADGITSLYGNSLVLGSDVKVLFYLDIDTDKAVGASIEIGRESDFADGKTVNTLITELETVKIAEKTYYKIGYCVPAKDISDMIKVRLVRADGTFGTEYSYSAQNYIDTVKAHDTSIIYSAELKALVSALEAYGSNASAVLDAIPDNTVFIADSKVDWTKVTEASGNISDDKAIKLNNFSLVLKSNIKLRVYFSINSVAATEGFTAKINGEAVNATKVSDGVWFVEKPIVAAKLNDTFTFTVVSGDSTLTLNLSALYYAKRVSQKAETEAEKNLMKAIFKYWQEADMYSKYTNSEDNAVQGAEKTQSVLAGKTIYGFGDSLVQGHYSNLGMLDGLTSEYGMVYTKYAKGGNTITINGAKSNVYSQVQAASNVCPDFVVFNGLTNDVGQNALNCTLGEITSGFNGEYDTTTFCGSFEATIKLMKEKYPTAKIIFVTPHKMPTRDLESFKLLVDTSLEICEKWGISVVDIYYDGDIDTTNDSQRVVYSYNNTESEGNGNGTHLTSTGYDIFYAPQICKKMAELCLE